MFQAGHLVLDPFIADYRCFSMNRGHNGGIILPRSAFAPLMARSFHSPLILKLLNVKTLRQTHCGVLCFSADEGRACLPKWIMKTILLKEGSLVRIENVVLPTATYLKFQPLSEDFLNVVNPAFSLESALIGFSCLTRGDMIEISYDCKEYTFLVIETQPDNAVSLIDSDLTIEFTAPVCYVDQSKMKSDVEYNPPMATDALKYKATEKFNAFTGRGYRLDGNPVPVEHETKVDVAKDLKRGTPDVDYHKGKITFARASEEQSSDSGVKEVADEKRPFVPFSGQGFTLGKKANEK